MDTNIIYARRAEIGKEIERHNTKLEQLQAELADLDTAERVLARLTGAKRTPAGPIIEQKPAAVLGGAAPKKLSMPKMILRALHKFDVVGGLSPKDVTAEINRHWGPYRGEQVSAIMWRMWKRGELIKDEDEPLYSLPPTKSAPDATLFLGTSGAGFLHNHPAQGREAGPGGGT